MPEIYWIMGAGVHIRPCSFYVQESDDLAFINDNLPGRGLPDGLAGMMWRRALDNGGDSERTLSERPGEPLGAGPSSAGPSAADGLAAAGAANGTAYVGAYGNGGAGDDGAAGWPAVSVTITRPCKDIDNIHLAHMLQFMRAEGLHGAFSLERGENEEHLHLQGVVRSRNACANVMSRRVKAFLSTQHMDMNTHKVKCNGVKGHEGYTYTFMLGYIQKDKGKTHYKMVTNNVIDEELSKGWDAYVERGAGALKKIHVLDTRHLMSKVYNYWRWNMNGSQAGMDNMAFVLQHMIRSRKFVPSAQWIVPFQGKGMVRERAQAAWRMLAAPEEVDISDVDLVFYDEPGNGVLPSSRSQQGRYFSAPPERVVPGALTAGEQADVYRMRYGPRDPEAACYVHQALTLYN